MQSVSRRQACLILGLAPLFAVGTASRAAAEEATAAALASAQEQYAAVQAQINSLAAQLEALSTELSATLDAMESKQAEIEATQAQVEITQAQVAQTQAELEACQDELAVYMVIAYKYGNTSAIEVILESKSFDELFRNVYYLTKINDSTTELIAYTKDVKQQLEEQQAALEEQQAALEEQYAQLETLRSQQQSQLAEMQSRQNEAYALLSNLDAEVQALTEQYNQELIAQAEAEAEAQRLAAASASGVTYGSTSAAAVVSACYSTPSPGAGYCAAWVTNVMINAGVGAFYGNACDMYASWCTSSDRNALQTGMIIAVSTHTGTSAGRIYGHVGIYIGGSQVMDNIGYIRTISLDSWISTYSTTVTVRWGWLGGVVLS